MGTNCVRPADLNAVKIQHSSTNLPLVRLTPSENSLHHINPYYDVPGTNRSVISKKPICYNTNMDNGTIHELKSWPEFFNEIIVGRKTHELRRLDDRDFHVGDMLCLKEFDPKTKTYTAREALAEVTYITAQMAPCAYSTEALKSGFCILSIKFIKQLM